MNDLIAEGAVVVQNATILSDVTVDHSNVSVASVNCNQSIITHDKVDGWDEHVNESELMDGVARSELMSGSTNQLMNGSTNQLMNGSTNQLMNATTNQLTNETTKSGLVNEITNNELISTPSAASLISSDSLASSSIPVLPTPMPTTLQSASLMTEELMSQTPVQEDSRPVDYWMSFSPVSLTNNSSL